MADEHEQNEEQPAAPAQQQPDAAPVLSLADLAKKHGQLRAVNPDLEDSPLSPEHMAAAVLHGWNAFAFFKGGQVMLSDADYLAALEAVGKGEAHGPADFTAKAAPPDPDFAKRHFKAVAEQRAAARAKGGQQ